MERAFRTIVMYDINSYKHVIVDYTNDHNDKDYLMGYLERLHDLKNREQIELDKLPFDGWIKDLKDNDNKELFKLLPYLSLGLRKYKPNKLSKPYQYGRPPFNEGLKQLNIFVSKIFLTST